MNNAIREVAYLAMNKGGTMESLFHPYAKVLFCVR